MAKKKSEDLTEDVEELTVPEAAALKGVTESRVYQWISEGRLTKHVDARFGRVLVNRAELDSLQHLKRGRPKKATEGSQTMKSSKKKGSKRA